jgi:hypothetical protein
MMQYYVTGRKTWQQRNADMFMCMLVGVTLLICCL